MWINPQINGEKFVFFLNVNLTVVPYTVATDLNGVFEGISIKNKIMPTSYCTLL